MLLKLLLHLEERMPGTELTWRCPAGAHGYQRRLGYIAQQHRYFLEKWVGAESGKSRELLGIKLTVRYGASACRPIAKAYSRSGDSD